ncbi:MAG: TrbC/VirB2 family protein [Gammaproteobacteria bacterium]|nr:TrbC/VirB2 family protein [Gammaproteobacteria bacterium]
MNKFNKFVITTKQKINILTISIFVFFTTSAYAEYSIGGPKTGPLAKVTAFVQDIINFIDGPVATAFSFFCIAGVAILWAIAPKMVMAMGTLMRVIIAIIIILNIGVWITAFRS